MRMYGIERRVGLSPWRTSTSLEPLHTTPGLPLYKRLPFRRPFMPRSGNLPNPELHDGVSLRPGLEIPTRMRLSTGLRGADFRHPLDQQNTALLQAIPGLEAIAKGMLGPVTEQVLLIENISTSVKVGPEQLPSVHKLLLEAAEILQMECPEVYIRQSATPNAYTLAIAGRKPFIVVHTSLLELLTLEEIQVHLHTKSVTF